MLPNKKTLPGGAKVITNDLRASIKTIKYLNMPFLNTGSVSGIQYLENDLQAVPEIKELNESIYAMDQCLSSAFSKYASHLK